jgi:hypothetical protein
MTTTTGYDTKIVREQGGDRMAVTSGGSFDVESGGELDIEAGGALKIAGTALTPTAAEINKLAGVTAGAATASKAAVLGANKELDEVHTAALYLGAGAGTLITLTAAQINAIVNAIVGTAAGKKMNFGEGTLDGSNPTSVAHGLTTCTSFVALLKGTAAPGVGTSVLTSNINGANVDIYAWKPTSNADPTLVASTGTESFYWIAAGT